MKRSLIFAYGVLCYLIFLGTCLYALGFVGNFWFDNTLDSPRQGSLWLAVLVDLALLGLFAVQHSVMARPAFKRWWTRYVPMAAERSTYVLFSCIALVLMCWLWQPLGGTVWQVDNEVGRMLLIALFAYGWLLVLISSFLLNHFDLFGLRQVWLYLRGREYVAIKFSTPGLYRWVRHPIYLGWLLAFWAAPTMSVAHLLFALTTTAYILIAIRLEERDLVSCHGERYVEYRRQVPMLVPGLKSRKAQSEATAN